jgi:hypothetical protein
VTASRAHPSTGRRLAGLAVGLVLLACVGYPVVMAGVLAYASFTGCFIECTSPDPGVGLVWSAVAAVALALSLGVGMAVAGVRSRAAWLGAAAVVLLAVAGWDLLAVAA